MKFLIITFYYPPCNGTPSPRPYSWAKAFTEAGHGVTVVTRYWKDSDNYWDDYISSTDQKAPTCTTAGNLVVWSIPFRKLKYRSSKLINKISTITQLLRGNLEREVNTFQFFDKCDEILSKDNYDAIITSAPPWNIVRLGYKLSIKHNVPHIPDFRDFENDMTLNQQRNAALNRTIEFYINRYYMFKWTRNAPFLISASKTIGNYITARIGVKNVEILNGFEKEKLEIIEDKLKENKNFTISVIGYMYPAQPLEILFQGFRIFLNKYDNPKIRFNFIGQNGIPEVARLIRENMDATYINMTNRKPSVIANQIGKNSHVLFYAGWKGWKGVYSAKLATYLGLKRNILIAPGDNDVIDKVVTSTNAGVIKNSAEECAEQIADWYEEWQRNGDIKYYGNSELIDSYSRKGQANKFLKAIENHIK